jgi:hypothetical protein
VLRNGNFNRRTFGIAAIAIGEPRLTPHGLRHTAASLAIAAGGDVKVVQQMLGHATASMTLDLYRERARSAHRAMHSGAGHRDVRRRARAAGRAVGPNGASTRQFRICVTAGSSAARWAGSRRSSAAQEHSGYASASWWTCRLAAHDEKVNVALATVDLPGCAKPSRG